MKYIKTFESFSPVNEEEEFLKKFLTGESAYKETAEFLDSDSEEAKKVKEIYSEIKKQAEEDGEFKDGKVQLSAKNERDPFYLQRMKAITNLGKKWGDANKMDPKFFGYSQIKTVLEKDFDRYFRGGAELPGTKGPIK